ncbi:hypothetical protein, partial [Ensifer sp. LC54]|uniref:hypothetical protein n=1 Tax=Ensifer sp. LC54 TaxID=1873715 RepID=UPI001AED0F17
KKLVMLCPCRTTFNSGPNSSRDTLPQPQTPSRAAGSFNGRHVQAVGPNMVKGGQFKDLYFRRSLVELSGGYTVPIYVLDLIDIT